MSAGNEIYITIVYIYRNNIDDIIKLNRKVYILFYRALDLVYMKTLHTYLNIKLVPYSKTIKKGSIKRES